MKKFYSFENLQDTIISYKSQAPKKLLKLYYKYIKKDMKKLNEKPGNIV